MPTITDELEGSGDFSFGPDGGDGSISFFVLQAASQDEAVDAALADPRAPESINGYQRGRVQVSHKGGNYYEVLISYKRGIPDKAPTDAGQPPPGQQTPGKDPHEQLTRDVSFSTGGATKKLYVSVRTRYGISKNSGLAPNFNKLIGVDVAGGKVEGTEVFAPEPDFTVTKRFQYLTVGWWRAMLSTVACTNDAPYLGLDIGEVLFKGCDGQFKDDDKTGYPWTVTGRFGFHPNKTIAANPEECTLGEGDDKIELPSVRGWEYLWVIYEKQTRSVTIDGVARDYIVQVPKFAYCEVVYSEKDLGVLGLT